MPAGAKARVAANFAAIEALHRIGDRPATADEQTILAGWSSWGAVPQVFDPANADFADDRNRLRELLTEAEWRAAARTTINAHYTDHRITQLLWDTLHRLGLPEHATVLEPGCGSGNFIGHAPEQTHMIGVELDPITAAIAAKLYPSADIRAESFAETRGVAVDAAIGNVPFADVVLHDPAGNPGRHSIHNHFIVKSLAMTQPGGLVAALTSRYTLDGSDPAARQEMADLADLVGAIRLPSGAHRRTAGTQVVTDILIFRRHTEIPDPNRERPTWVDTAKITIDGTEHTINQWFRDRPDDVLGQLASESSQYATPTLNVRAAGDLAELLPAALDRTVEAATAAGLTWQPYDQDSARHVVQLGGLPDTMLGHIRGSAHTGFQVATQTGYQPLEVPATQVQQMEHLLRLRDHYLALIEAESTSRDDLWEHRELRAALNQVYDAYHEQYGPLNQFTETATKRLDKDGNPIVSRRYPPVITKFKQDPHAPYVLALEVFDETDQRATKAAVLRGRVLVPRRIADRADTPEDALMLSLDQHGRVDLTAIAGYLDTTPELARSQLGELVYDDPADPGGGLVPAAGYLSGNVRVKLEQAREAAETDARYSPNVAALSNALPPDLHPGQIVANLGAVWIEPAEVQAFLRETLDDRRVEVSYDAIRGWRVENGDNFSLQATSEWGTERMSAPRIAKRLLNQTIIRVTDEHPDGGRIPNPTETEAAREKGSQLQERFRAWVWEDPGRADRLAARYNELFNSIVPRRDYSRPLTLPGLARSFCPQQHQLNAVARVIQEGSVGIWHPVGYGKTAIMVMSIMEQRRLGLVRKPAMVVPNHMLEQVRREFLQLYPAAKVLAAGTDDLTGDKRRQFVARATNGDWDAVVLTRTALERLPVSPETMTRYIDEEVEPMRRALEAQLAESDQSTRRSMSVKSAQKSIQSQEERIKAKIDADRDPGVSFEQTGIDYMCVDEIHDYKNLYTASKIVGAGIRGSERATDLHMKVNYLRSRYGSRAILGASATPISNSITEVHVMMRYLAPDLLDNADIRAFDRWAATFGQVVSGYALAPEGNTWKETTRFARFQNVPELLTLWNQVGDSLDTSNIQLPRPELAINTDGKREPEIVVVPASEDLLTFTQDIGRRAELIRTGAVSRKEDNMLVVSNDGRAAALDLRLVDADRLRRALTDGIGEPQLDFDTPTKTDVAAANIHRIWQAHKDQIYLDPATGEPHPRTGALQLVFSDLGTPNDKGRFDVYEDLRDKLIRHGIPASQIRIIHEAKTDRDKDRIFAAARAGEIAVLIGSTEKMGQGTNVQARAIALHHLDPTWKPSEIEQREGRIVRQGNQNPEVEIYRYTTQKSFDGYMWQTLARKSRFIDQIMSGQATDREADDIATDTTFSFQAIQSVTTDNPYIQEKHEVEAEIARLERLARAHRDTQRSLNRTVDDLTRTIAHTQDVRIPGLEDAVARTRDTRGDNFQITIGDRIITKRADAAAELGRRAIRHSATQSGAEVIGQLAGHDLTLTRHLGPGGGVQIQITEYTRPVTLTSDELRQPSPSQIVRLENAVTNLPQGLENARQQLTADSNTLDRARARIGEPFPHEAALDQLKVRKTEIDAKIADLAHGGTQGVRDDDVGEDGKVRQHDRTDGRTAGVADDHGNRLDAIIQRGRDRAEELNDDDTPVRSVDDRGTDRVDRPPHRSL